MCAQRRNNFFEDGCYGLSDLMPMRAIIRATGVEEIKGVLDSPDTICIELDLDFFAEWAWHLIFYLVPQISGHGISLTVQRGSSRPEEETDILPPELLAELFFER